jgi:dTDP-4-dehydrorhamnose reductase
MKRKTILIFGISSFVGSNLAELLKDKYRVIGTYFRTPVDMPGILSIKCDVHEKDVVQKVVYLFKPDITIYCVGLTRLQDCQEYPKLADALNTAGVFNVSQASERYKSKFVFISSNFIFSGEDTLFRENDTPSPTSVYGNTIASAEFYIQKSCLNYLILRCCPIFGRCYNPNDIKWLELVDRKAFKAEQIVCDTKVYHGFLDVWTLAEILDKAIELNITNRLFQISSCDIANRYEFTKLYIEKVFGNSSLLVKGDWGFPRTENQITLQGLGEELKFEMDTFNAEETFEIDLPTIEEVVDRIAQKYGVKNNSKVKKASTGISYI